MDPIDVRMLGPLEVRVGGRIRKISGNNTRKVLAMLLDEANRYVPIEGLKRGVWDGDEPGDPVRQIRNRVSDLRSDLGAAKDRIVLADSRDAYKFGIAESELDVLRVRAAERRAAGARAAGRLDEAAAELRAALAEFRGAALAGLSGRMIGAIVRRLDGMPSSIMEQCFEVELDLGRHEALVAELHEAVQRHPSRERFAAQYMLALHASGRSVEALEFHEAHRRRLADELGVDPGPHLRGVHTQILRDGADATPPAPPSAPVETAVPPAPTVPDTLPPASVRFTGRGPHLADLDRALAAAEGQAGTAVVTGMGGVGKTALAVHWARTVADRFPDGRLYFDLRGFDPVAPETGPGPTLGKVLRRLGVERSALPTDADEQADLYRTLMAGRRVLVVLDNARDAQQVRPLLSGAPGSFTIVTSRNRLPGLIGSGAASVSLRPLDPAESSEVLGRFLDGDLAESRAAQRIIAVCAGLPLALCLAGAWAAAHPDLPLSALADRLESTGNVLRVLSSDDPTFDPRTVFSCSYQELGSSARRAFRLLGLHPGPDITAAALGGLAGVEPRRAGAMLAELATVQLVHEHQPGRFTMHDLLRAFAVERLEETSASERAEAAARMVDHYLHTADRADAILYPFRSRLDFGGPAEGAAPQAFAGLRDAADWFAAELPVLRGLVQAEPRPGHDERTWRLAWCLSEHMSVHHRSQELVDAQAAALAAARRGGDVRGQIVSLGYMAAALSAGGRDELARPRVDNALELADAHGDVWAKGFALYGLGLSLAREGRDRDALEYLRLSEGCLREAGEPSWLMRCSYAIGWHAALVGELVEARERFEQVMAFASAAGGGVGEALGTGGLGLVAHREQRFEEALRLYEEAAEMYRRSGMAAAAAQVEDLSGDVHAEAGRKAAACQAWWRAFEVYERAGAVREAELVRGKLASAGCLQGPFEGPGEVGSGSDA